MIGDSVRQQEKIANVTNIDLLGVGNECDQDCRQCFFREQGSGNALGIGDARRIINRYDAQFYIYPKEIATSLETLPLYREVGQAEVLTNGVAFGRNPGMFDLLEKYGIRKMKFTLFAKPEEQEFLTRAPPEDYEDVREAVRTASRKGFETIAFNILYRGNIPSIPEMCRLSRSLGVNGVEFLRLLPLGNATTCLPTEAFPDTGDMEYAFNLIEEQRETYGRDELYLKMGMDFGPDFSGERTRSFLKGRKEDWPRSRYLCPAVNTNFLGISARTGSIYPCFKLISDPDSVIGEAEGDEIVLDPSKTEMFSEEALRERLRGRCSSGSCEYQGQCLGGCRALAYSIAKMKGEEEPLYAGMDFCRSNRSDNDG